MDAVQSIDYIDGITLEMLVEGGGSDLLDEANAVLYEDDEEEEALPYTEDVAAGHGVSSDEDDDEEIFTPVAVYGVSDEDPDDVSWDAQADDEECFVGDKSGKVPLDLPPELKRYLELDHFQVCNRSQKFNFEFIWSMI
jgi:hypothetical protein